MLYFIPLLLHYIFLITRNVKSNLLWTLWYYKQEILDLRIRFSVLRSIHCIQLYTINYTNKLLVVLVIIVSNGCISSVGKYTHVKNMISIHSLLLLHGSNPFHCKDLLLWSRDKMNVIASDGLAPVCKVAFPHLCYFDGASRPPHWNYWQPLVVMCCCDWSQTSVYYL